MYTGYLSDLYKKFQILSTYDTDAEYQIWNFAIICFGIMLLIDAFAHKQTERNQPLKMWFSDSGSFETCKFIKISIL